MSKAKYTILLSKMKLFGFLTKSGKSGFPIPGMSLARLILPYVTWGEFLEVLSYLSTHEIQCTVGRVSRCGYLTSLFIRNMRQCPASRKGSACFLSRSAWALARLSPGPSVRAAAVLDKVLLASYPRSGNSFLRRLLEEHTGVVTGSDSRSNRTLSASLLRFGFRGEGITDASVWVVKSHFPERMGYVRVRVHRGVLLVRNPFDAIESAFHMGLTNTHDKVLHPEVMHGDPRVSALWEEFAAAEARVWADFHFFWMHAAFARDFPVFIVRFEDVLVDPAAALASIQAFMSSSQPQTGCYRPPPQAAAAAPVVARAYTDAAGPGYAPKPQTRRSGKSLSQMSPALLQRVVASAGPCMHALGYRVAPLASDGKDELGLGLGLGLEAGEKGLVLDSMSVDALADFHRTALDSLDSPSADDTDNANGCGVSAAAANAATALLLQPQAPAPNSAAPSRVSATGSSQCRGGATIGSIDSSGPMAGTGGLVINSGGKADAALRGADDRFGRGMTDIRQSLTARDTLPLRTA